MLMNRVQLSCNDFILLFAFSYSTVDIILDWNKFSTCSRPIQMWLLVSYASIFMFRVLHYVGWMLSADGEDFLIYHQHGPPKWVNALILGVLYPFFLVWTVLGSVWFGDIMQHSRTCLPPGSNTWFLIFWLLLCYIWVLIYSCFIGVTLMVEWRTYQATQDLRSVESIDSLRRWGRLQLFPDYNIFQVGLSPRQIAKLPIFDFSRKPMIDSACSICLDEMSPGDQCRQLGCDHVFHSSCIDIWLLRRADCPNCKAPIMAPPCEV